MNPSVLIRNPRASRLALHLTAWTVAVLVAAFLGGCSESGTSGPDEPDPPDISTPAGAIDALEVQYGYRRVDEAVALLAPGYHFLPLDPAVIDFLEPGETSWAHADETAILHEILVPTRSTWLDQVLLEITIRSVGAVENGRVAVRASTDLHFLVGEVFERSRSIIEYLFEIQPNGDHLLLEERELGRDEATDMPTVGEQKARGLAGVAP